MLTRESFTSLLFFLFFLQTHGDRLSSRLPNNVLNFNKRPQYKSSNDNIRDKIYKNIKTRSIFKSHSNDINQPIGPHNFFNHVTTDDQSSTKHSCHMIRSTDNLYSELPYKNIQHLHHHHNQRSKKHHKLHHRRRRHQHKLLKKFYDKYTEAYGILVLSPKSVPDSALKRACYVLRFLLADRTDMRRAFQKKGGRVVVLGRKHYIADVPEYKQFLQQQKHYPQQQRVKQILKRFKNVPSNRMVAITTTTEENLLCYKNFSNMVTQVNFVEEVFNHNHTSKPPTQVFPLHKSSYRLINHNQRSHNKHHYANRHNCHHHHGKHKHDKACRGLKSRDDITLKSLSIGILNLAVPEVDASLVHRLQKAYKHALLSGLWLNTDAASDVQSYFGEGVQSYYNANAYARPANGYNNDINSRVKLKSHDPELYAIVHEVFPCANNYVKRCGSRRNEAKLFFEMDCPIHRWKEK